MLAISRPARTVRNASAKVTRWLVSVSAGFCRDLLDRSAVQKPHATGPDMIAIGLASLAGIGSLAESLHGFVVNVLGLPAGYVYIAAIMLASILSLVAIVAKVQSDMPGPLAGFLPNGRVRPPLTYAFIAPLRHLGKATLTLFILGSTTAVEFARSDIVDLPSTLYGYVVDANTGRPIAEVNARIISAGGVDITSTAWPSDSSGFYIATASTRVRRNATIRFQVANCDSIALPLSSAFETRTTPSGRPVEDDLKPVFRHAVTLCKGES